MKRIISMLSALLLLSGCGYSEADRGEQTYENVTDPLPHEENIEITEATSLTEAVSEAEQLSVREGETLYDIHLRVSSSELLVGEDDDEVIWYAEVPADCEPEKVMLIDADTGEIAAELFDEADFEKYGDTIKGDAVYNCRFTVNMDIDTDPDVSEERYYHYYARFEENGTIHCSETTEIWVLEPFSDKELYDMEAVDDAISELMDSEEFEQMSVKEKAAQAKALLVKLSKEGTPDRPYSLVIANSIYVDGDMISFSYSCGVDGGIMLTPWDKYMN